MKAGVWVQRGTLLGRMDFFTVQCCPPDRILSFCNEGEKKKAIMLENCSLEALGLLLTNAKGSEETLFVISMRKKTLFFYVNLKLLAVLSNSSTM